MIGIFLRGLLMGAADAIPGVSGGTIAFITGIYERLITAVKAWSDILVRRRIEWRRLEIPFLLSLGAGILVAVFSMAHLVTFLLERYFVITISFFVGLILASALFIFNQIDHHRDVLFGLIGVVVGIGITFIAPSRLTDVSLAYLFLSGVIGISAMFLPGLSGAFILVIMGSYEFLLRAVKSADLASLGIFAAGAAVGAIIISRIIAFLLLKDREKTLYALLGLVIGALSVPIRDIALVGFASGGVVVGALIALITGAGSVLLAERWAS